MLCLLKILVIIGTEFTTTISSLFSSWLCTWDLHFSFSPVFVQAGSTSGHWFPSDPCQEQPGFPALCTQCRHLLTVSATVISDTFNGLQLQTFPIPWSLPWLFPHSKTHQEHFSRLLAQHLPPFSSILLCARCFSRFINITNKSNPAEADGAESQQHKSTEQPRRYDLARTDFLWQLMLWQHLNLGKALESTWGRGFYHMALVFSVASELFVLRGSDFIIAWFGVNDFPV